MHRMLINKMLHKSGEFYLLCLFIFKIEIKWGLFMRWLWLWIWTALCHYAKRLVACPLYTALLVIVPLVFFGKETEPSWYHVKQTQILYSASHFWIYIFYCICSFLLFNVQIMSKALHENLILHVQWPLSDMNLYIVQHLMISSLLRRPILLYLNKHLI